MESQNDYEINEKEEKASEEYFDLSKAKLVGRNAYRRQAPNNTNFDPEEYLEVMGDDSERDQRDKISDIIEDIKEYMVDVREKIKNMDSVKIVLESWESIKKSIEEITLLGDFSEEILKEFDDRSLTHPVVDKLRSEMEEIKQLKGYDFERTVKQLIGRKAVEIGKETIKGTVNLGYNMIGASIMGVRKTIKGIKKLGEGSIKFKNKDSKIKPKREKYYIKDEEVDLDETSRKNKQKGDIAFADYRYHVDDIEEDFEYLEQDDEEEYVELETEPEKAKKDNLFKRTIKGVKNFISGVGKKFVWIKDKESRQAFKNKQKEIIKNTKSYRKAVELGKDVKDGINLASTRAKIVKNDIKSGAENAAVYVKSTAEEVVTHVKTNYEQAKERYNKRKNDRLISALEKGSHFSENQLEAIKNFIEKATNENEVKQAQSQKGRNTEQSTLDR